MKNIGHKQEQTARYFQATRPPRIFQKGDHVLWCPRDPKIRKIKFESIWHGPYRVQLVLPNNTVLLVNSENFNKYATIVNSTKLKHYHSENLVTPPTLSLGEIYKTLATEAQASMDPGDTAQQTHPQEDMDSQDIHVNLIQVIIQPNQAAMEHPIEETGLEIPSPRIMRPPPPQSTLATTHDLGTSTISISTPWRPRIVPSRPPRIRLSHNTLAHWLSSLPTAPHCDCSSNITITHCPRLIPLGALVSPSSPIAHTVRELETMESTERRESKRVEPPFHVPRMVYEWKRRPDLIWNAQTGLDKYWAHLEGKVNIKHCHDFVTSMRKQDETDPYPAGEVEGILVQFSARYLHKFFGWDGLGITGWSATCGFSKPDIAARVGDLQPYKEGRYSVFALGNHMLDPWFSRMRGVLSQIYFQNNCNGILPEQLSLLLLADQGAKINWGLLVEENFRIQLRGYRMRDDYSSPIGPFLTSYIAHFLSFYRKNNQPPRMGSFLDVQSEIAATAGARDPA